MNRKITFPITALLLSLGSWQGDAAEESVTDEKATMTPEAMEALYLERFNALTDRTSKNGLSRYDPLAPVGGSSDYQPLPKREGNDRLISSYALLAAVDYAGRNRSSALLIWVDGALELEHYFGDNDADTLLVGKSLAKPLGVIATGRALAEGHIESLDQPVADFITPWIDTPKAAITLRQLLGNRSGLLPQGAAPTADNILNRAYMHPAHDEVIINDYPLVDVPGERYEYSNANSELVAPLLERATGVSYEDWLHREVLSPIGARGGQIWMNRPGGTPHSGCCVLLPAESFLRLALLLLNDGEWNGEQLLPEGYVAAMRTSTPQNPHAGLGVYLGYPYIERRGALNPERTIGRTLHSEPYAADDLFLFDGNSNQVAYIVPSKKLVILRMGAWAPEDPEWDNAYLPNVILNDLKN